jgi:signal transduction histidine kinase
MEGIEQRFDREFTLAELLSGVNLPVLAEQLKRIVGGEVRLRTMQGAALLETPPGLVCATRIEVRHELEPMGYLEADTSDRQRVEAAARLLEMLLKANARYHMASQLHLDVVHEDYDTLQRKHAELTASEGRYKALAENLEERVAEQVKTIESAQRQLFQAEKMASVGQLAAGMAHEINNPVGFIRSNLSTAQSYVGILDRVAQLAKTSGSAEVAAYWRQENLGFILEDFATLLEESVAGADRVARIVSDLKDFSNIDQAEEQIADINACIRSVCNVALAQVSKQAELVLTLADLPSTRCRPGHLNQVFLNLLLNAAQAMDRPGQIRITTHVERESIGIEISDTGRGMAPEVQQRIFDPFFTTREVGQGTGLGLTVARDIIAAHGGMLSVESKLGQGATFTIKLPVTA